MSDWGIQYHRLLNAGVLLRLRKLSVALVLAPALLGAAVTAGAALTMVIALDLGMTRLASSSEMIGPAALALYGFAGLFGVPGVLGLWALGAQDRASWSGTGAILGLAAGAIFELVLLARIDVMVPVFCAIMGTMLFLLIRWISGVQDRRFYH